MNKIIINIALIFSSIFCVCTKNQPHQPKILSKPSSNNIQEFSDTLRIQKNARFDIRLDVPVASGYLWFANDCRNVKLLTHNPPEIISEKDRNDGGFGYQLFSFEAIEEGKSVLTFSYRRPFGKPTSADSSAHYCIIIY